jgi:hypothetical protein
VGEWKRREEVAHGFLRKAKMPPTILLSSLPTLCASMTTSNINGKQKDRVAYWSGSGTSSGGGSYILADQQKSYRARGCRGGTSRKNRKKYQPSKHENEENDPHRLNISGKHPYKNHVNDEDPPGYKIAADDSSNKHYAEEISESSGGSRILEESKLESQAHPQRKMRTLPILPSSSGLSVREEDQQKQEIQTEKSEAELLIQSRDIKTNNGHSPTNSLAHIHFNSTTPRNTTVSGRISAIARPSSAQSPGRQSGVGFSFFCVSPSSFLAGRFAAKQKLVDSDYVQDRE